MGKPGGGKGGAAGQRSISAFFKKPTAGAAAKPPPAPAPGKGGRAGGGGGSTPPPSPGPGPEAAAALAAQAPPEPTAPRPGKRKAPLEEGANAPARKPWAQGAGQEGGGEAGAASAAAASPPPLAPPAAAGTGAIPERRAGRHRKFQDKLVLSTDERLSRRLSGGGAQGGGEGGGGARQAAGGRPKEKYSPLEEQVVALRNENPGVLLIVEVGYKYRFFGDDAEAASKALNIFAYHDRNFLTASIPTFRLHVHVRRLVEAGHKVGVVRQVETAAIKAQGPNKSAPFDRRLTAVYTRATLEAGADLGGGGVEAAGAFEGESLGFNSRLSSYLLSVVESPAGAAGAGAAQGGARIGVVAVETSTGAVLYGSLADDGMRTELESILLQVAPSELLLAEPLSAPTERLLKAMAAHGGLRVERVPRRTYEEGGAVAAVTSFYAGDGGGGGGGGGEGGGAGAGAGGSGSCAALDAVLTLPDEVLQSLAHALDFLRPFKLEGVLRVSRVFRPFAALDEMQLTPNTLRQLEVLSNSDDGGEKGSLLWVINHTRTPFGGRMLRQWVCHPLMDHRAITERLDAVEELSRQSAPGEGTGAAGGGGALGARALAALPDVLSALPDVERGVTRAFHRTTTPAEFAAVMGALEGAMGRLACPAGGAGGEAASWEAMGAGGVASPLLRRLLDAATSPQVGEALRSLLQAIDRAAAKEGDKLKLFVDSARFPAVADCRAAIAEAEGQLAGLLPGIRKELKMPRVEYFKVSGEEYLIEVPVKLAVPGGWAKINATKANNRFRPPAVAALHRELEIARERLAAACDAAWASYLEGFAEHYVAFREAVQSLAALDCLHSLAVVARNEGYCRPEVLPRGAAPELVVEAGRHPVLDAMLPDGAVPNSLALRGGAGRAVVVTGPNMGGKSCLIRQVALTAIMAQVGSFVPAESAQLTVLDAVFTRMGASDNLAMGRSTFLEELSETSYILERASEHSLVILDELGRGTSTHDGVAIASATLRFLLERVRCLTLFVTHYPESVRGGRGALLAEKPEHLSAYHMSYLQEGASVGEEEGAGEGDGAPPKITFLYRLAPGVASSSFGLNVARMARLPPGVIRRAHAKANELEAAAQVGGGVGPALRVALDALAGAGEEGEGGEVLADAQKVAREALGP